MCRKIEAIIAREEAFLPKFAPGTSQHSLLANRISALRTVCDLASDEHTPSIEELQFALPRIESIIHKTSVARDKYKPGSCYYKRFPPIVQQMEEAKALILHAINNS